MEQLLNNIVRPETSRPSAMAQALGLLYAPIHQELIAVEEILRRELRSDYPFVDALVKHGFRLGGKRLRPAMLLLAAKAAGQLGPDHLVLAAVVEMIHTATLVHDDVLDEATLRRHLETANSRWSNKASVLLGDYLFTHSFYLASTTGSTFACQTIGRTTNVVCEGELRQIDSRGNFDLTEEEYFGIIQAKTAELCACCCRLGAHYAGAEPDQEEALDRYGRYLGMAFQIVDDLLDLLGDEATAGKSLGTDLEQQKPTLPLIRLLSRSDPRERTDLLTILNRADNHRRESLEPWLAGTDAFSYARAKALDFAGRARAELAGVKPSPARDVLQALPDFVVNRQH